jgi:dipeptidyl aminopeptidase/acylaminoacyl peptidase
MTLRSATRFLALLALVCASFFSRADEPKTKRPLAIDDLYRLERVRATALSLDGRTVVYERQWIDTSGRERHDLWNAQTPPAGVRAAVAWDAESLERDVGGEYLDGRSPVWSPHGTWIALLSTRPRPRGWTRTPPAAPEVEPATDIWLKSAGDDPAIPLAGPDKPYGRVFNDGFYGHVAFSPDGTKIAFIADDGKDRRTPEEIAAGAEVVRTDQGEGYTGYGAAQVWVAYLRDNADRYAARRIERLTNDNVWYGDPHWSPDGKQLVVVANKTADRESARYSINKNFDLYTINVETKAQRRITDGPGPEVSPRWSPDGKSIACLSIPRKGSHMDTFNLAVVRLDGDTPKTTVLFDHHAAGDKEPLHPAPSFPLPEDCWADADHLVYNAAAGTTNRTINLDLKTGQGKDFKRPPAPEPPPVNALLKERRLGESRVVTWDNGDGHKVEGILTLPPEGVAKPPYRMILFPHGGPHSRSVVGFDFTVQVFAASGYAVFQPNFRGSAGYGQKWIDADRGDLGGGDMRDIFSGIELLVKEKIVDPQRQFVYGVSYGGFMTCWLVGHTRQFRAAVAQNAVTDLNAMWGLSDLQSWTEWEFGGKPWEVPEKMRKHSPIAYADKIETPTLILHSRDDRRCPLPMGKMFHQALRARQVPTQLVIYPDEGHGIRQPRHQEDVLRRTLAWFEKYDRK